MEKNKRLLKFALFVVVLLAVAVALLRILAYNASSAQQAQLQQEKHIERRMLEDLKNEEILGLPAPSAAPIAKQEKRAMAVQRYARRPEVALNPRDYTLSAGNNFQQPPYAALPSVSAGVSLPSGNYTYHPKGFSPGNYGQYGSSAGSYASSAPETAPYQQAPGVYRPTAQEAVEAERERAFSPFLTGMNRKQQEQLQNQLKGLSSNIDRALAKALMPKSKKDANIEKYLQRNASPAAASAGPFAPVLDQVASQKAGVVQSMGNAFGKEAAQEAGQVMDDFQSEMSSAVNSPNMSSQQIAEKVKQVAQKYEQKLQKLSNDNSFKKFQQERIDKDNLLKEEISKQYGPEIAAQANQVIDAAREKDMKLAMQGLPAEEYYNKQAENQNARRKALEDIITKSGKSTKGLFEVENKLADEEVKKARQDEEEGKVLGRSYRASPAELKAREKSLNPNRQENVQKAGEIYGAEGARRVDAIYEKYQNEYMKIWQDPDSSKTDKEEASNKLRQSVNEELDNLQNDPQLKEARVNRQVDTSLAQIMKDPNIQQASPEQKAELEKRARPVLREMYEKVNQVMASDVPDAEKQKQIQQIQAEAQRKLSGQ